MRQRPVSQAPRDLMILTVVGALLYVLLTSLEVFGRLALWLHAQELVDDLVSLTLVAVGAFAVFSWRRWREIEAAQREIRVLSGVIRVCAWCRRARNATGGWVSLEEYVQRESDADISPDLCPDCAHRPTAGGRGVF